MRIPVKTILLALLLITNRAGAQPVISNLMPTWGYHTTMWLGTNITTAGGGGANASWDFSWQSSFNLLGDLEYMSIANTEFEVDFPTSNLVARKRIGGDTIYNYYMNLGTEVMIMGENMGAINGNNYTSNSKKLFNFPMAFGDSLVDTWQGTVANGTVRRYYDGYGELKTYFYTYQNVARIKTVDSFLVGASWIVNTSYTWYTTDRLLPVAHYDNASQQMTILRMLPVSVANAGQQQTNVYLYPNPAQQEATLHVAQVTPGMELVLVNTLGQIALRQPVTTTNTRVNREQLANGVYFYTVQGKDGIAAKGKLVLE
ncbi:MAG: T9SS type A sorting domain-containing protein [Flavipsychrobacter sp.]|nr:T9SS type A sorting domain-containing protein [Flavipsychrobacter sp.]